MPSPRIGVLSVAIVALCLSLSAFAAPKGRVTVHASKVSAHEAPSTWALLGPADPEHEITVIFAIKQRNLDTLDSLFWDVSNPRSKSYGKYLSLDKLAELVQPSQATINAVLAFVKKHNPIKVELVVTQDFASVTMRVADLSEMLATTFHRFEHKTEGVQHVSALGDYSVPAEIAAHLDFVSGVSGFPVLRSERIRAGQGKEDKKRQQGALAITPAIIRARYNVSASATGSSPNSTQAVAEFQYQYYSQTDLDSFYKQYVPLSKNSQVTKVVGQNTPSEPGIEASLDIQYIKGVAPEAQTWFWSVPAMDFWSDLTTWVSGLNSAPNTPLVHSISYGDQVAFTDPETGYQDRFNGEMKKLGVRGISIIFASGDSGTGCSACVWFSPSFPATCPYVTSVGATEFIDQTMTSEMAVSEFGSGGGFAWDFPAPSYQVSAIQSYLKNAPSLPESFYYTATGRGTPDVSALGWGFSVIDGGETTSVGGTSASAPTFAGIVTLLNDIRLSKGKASLGFLNQFLYQTAASTPGAFWDVTQGNNQDGCCGYTGFVCSVGWDPVSGLGTPNYAILSKVVGNLP